MEKGDETPLKKNKILYRMDKKLGSRCELKRIKKIKAMEAKKSNCSISNSSSSDPDLYSSLSSDGE